MNCPICGNPLRDKDKYCPNCGCQLSTFKKFEDKIDDPSNKVVNLATTKVDENGNVVQIDNPNVKENNKYFWLNTIAGIVGLLISSLCLVGAILNYNDKTEGARAMYVGIFAGGFFGSVIELLAFFAPMSNKYLHGRKPKTFKENIPGILAVLTFFMIFGSAIILIQGK